MIALGPAVQIGAGEFNPFHVPRQTGGDSLRQFETDAVLVIVPHDDSIGSGRPRSKDQVLSFCRPL